MTLPLILPDWPAPKRVKAYCTTRQGGHSKAEFAALNVGMHVGDDPSKVAANRKLLPNHQNIRWLNQVHGDICVRADRVADTTAADASFSNMPNIACAIMTADCLPILLCDRQGEFVAAIHAGWRSLAKGVIENTLHQYSGANQHLLAWLGPAISQRHFEVGPEVKAEFADHGEAFARSSNSGKFLADLYQIARAKLQALGVGQTYSSEHCTYVDQARFFSHRRATHNGTKQTGRMVSVIYLSEPC